MLGEPPPPPITKVSDVINTLARSDTQTEDRVNERPYIPNYYLLMASRRNRIRIFHPEYDPPELLSILPTDDGPDQDKTLFFVIYDAAHAFASNPYDALLSKSKDGSKRM